MKTGILFDLDGTLLDTLTDLCDSVNHILHKYGHPERTRQEVRCLLGYGARNLLHRALSYEYDEQEEARVFADYQEYYSAHCQVKTCPYDGILEALEQLKKSYPVAVVSNKPDIQVKPLCRNFFGDIYALGEQSGTPRKPAPDMILKAMKDIGVERCIYVGDSDVDILTARNAGVPCLSVLWGFRDREYLEEIGGKYFCSDPRQLPEIIKEIEANEE